MQTYSNSDSSEVEMKYGWYAPKYIWQLLEVRTMIEDEVGVNDCNNWYEWSIDESNRINQHGHSSEELIYNIQRHKKNIDEAYKKYISNRNRQRDKRIKYYGPYDYVQREFVYNFVLGKYNWNYPVTLGVLS